MIADLLLAADLVDVVANPSRTLEEHEAGAARLSNLAAHGAGTQTLSLENAKMADVDLLSGHLCRWALNEAKQPSGGELEPHLPQRDILQELFFGETDRVGRLLLTESALTHPETEIRLASFADTREPIPLKELPDVWPRDYLIQMSRSEGAESGRQTEANLTEFGMILLQIATPAAVTLLGGTIVALRRSGRETHPLIEFLRAFVAGQDESLAQRLGLRRGPDRFA